MPSAASGVRISETSTAAATTPGRSGRDARSSCIPSTRIIIGTAASLSSVIGAHDGAWKVDPEAQRQRRRHRAVHRGHARDSDDRVAQTSSSARSQQDAARVAEDRAGDEVDAGECQRLAAEGEERHRQPVVAGVRADDDKHERAERAPIESQRNRGEPGHRRRRDCDQEVKQRHPADLAALRRRVRQRVEDERRRKRVKGQARDGLDLDTGKARQQKPHTGDGEYRQEIGHEDREEELCGTDHVRTESYAVTGILPHPRRPAPRPCHRGTDLMKTVDVGAVIDEGRWTGYQKLLIFGTALTIILDGVDNQLLPNAVPTLITEWGRPRADFINALSIGPVRHDDRRADRRRARRSPWTSHGAARQRPGVCRAHAGDRLRRLHRDARALRFLAGVGLGGAMPNAATLASEYVPRRQRPFAVTLTIVCIPLGGAIAGELAARVIPGLRLAHAVHDWRRDSDRAGVGALEGPARVAAVSREATRAMARAHSHDASNRPRHPGRRRVHRSCAQPAATAPVKSISIGSLFGPTFVRDTLALCALVLLLPDGQLRRHPAAAGDADCAGRRLHAAGRQPRAGDVELSAASRAPSSARCVIQRLGSRITMLGMSAGAIVCALVLTGTRIDPSDTGLLMVMLLLTGGLLNAVQTTMYALAAHVYPTDIRSTGVGFAVAVGRIGNVLAGYVGAYALDQGGPPGYFTSMAVLMGIVFVSLAAVRRHVPRTTGAPRWRTCGRPLTFQSRLALDVSAGHN